jgi:hypothetical protein
VRAPVAPAAAAIAHAPHMPAIVRMRGVRLPAATARVVRCRGYEGLRTREETVGNGASRPSRSPASSISSQQVLLVAVRVS